MGVLLPLDLPAAKTHTVYRMLGDLHDMLRYRHEAIARVGSQMLPFLPCPLHVLGAWRCVGVRATPQRGRGVQADIGGRDAFGDSLAASPPSPMPPPVRPIQPAVTPVVQTSREGTADERRRGHSFRRWNPATTDEDIERLVGKPKPKSA
jgi:hypothetical protein